jgi:hypothetical protein
MQEQIEGAQQDGMKLGIKFGAKTLRGIADELAKEPANADYIRGLRDAALFIERFSADASAAMGSDAERS